jgi:hypothetical protein
VSSTPDPEFDYCPFCGMSLPADGVDAHLDEYDDCAARFDARRDAGGGLLDDVGEYRQEPSAVRTGVMILIVIVVLAYSLLVAGQLLLGILASSVVVAAFVLATRL